MYWGGLTILPPIRLPWDRSGVPNCTALRIFCGIGHLLGRRGLAAVVLAVVLGAAMTPARAATTDATLAGRVVADGTKEALPRICVTAEEFDNGRGGSQYTTTTG